MLVCIPSNPDGMQQSGIYQFRNPVMLAVLFQFSLKAKFCTYAIKALIISSIADIY